ncbi:MAG: stage V sporulation protein AC [Lachnospirales bacterium]
MNRKENSGLSIQDIDEKVYDEIVKEHSPSSDTFRNCIKAFVVGGSICVFAEIIKNTFIMYHIPKDDAGTYTSIILIFIAVILTGFGIYQKLGSFAGAGSIVPISGFANSVASPAIEFKKEGYVMGVGAKIFILAGPVILYGTVASIIVGVLYYFIG